MTDGREPFFHPDRYSSLPRLGPRPVPPHSLISSSLNQRLCNFAVKIPGRKKQAAPTDAPNDWDRSGSKDGYLTPARPGSDRGLAGAILLELRNETD